MVSVGVSSLGYTDLVFIDPGIKINGSYYRDTLLKHLLPAIHSVSGYFFTFQQDSAPAHRSANETVAPLSAETPDCISPLSVSIQQPGSQSGGLSDLGDFAGASLPLPDPRHRSLKERLDEEWRRFVQNVIDRAVNQWRDRLRKMYLRKRGTLRSSDLKSWIYFG